MFIKRNSGVVLLLLLAAALLYGQFLVNPIVFDDLPFFAEDAAGHQPLDAFSYSPFELRSLPYVTLTWSKEIFGLDMMVFRIENLVLHSAVAVALFYFLQRLFLLIIPVRAELQMRHAALAFSAALLFVLHPLAVYATGYLAQRTMLMATLFSLLAMLSYLHGSERDSKPWLWSSVLFYYMAVFSKEHAIMLPVIFVAMTVLLHEDWRMKLQQRWRLGLGFVIIAVLVIFAQKGVLGHAYETSAPEMLANPESDLNWPLSILTQSWLFFKYAALWLFPNPQWMSVDMREPFATSLWSVYLLALFVFLAWGGLAIWLLFKRGRLGLLGFSLIFPWLMFIPEFSTVRIQETFVLYRSYIWVVGACALLPLVLDALDKRVAAVIVGVVALAIFPISMERLATFSHPLTLWQDAAKLLEGKEDEISFARIYNNRGLEKLNLGLFPDAKIDFELAIRMNPVSPFAYTNLGATYLSERQFNNAIAAFNQAIEIMRKSGKNLDSRPFFGKAKTYEAMGDEEAARQNYELSCQIARKGCDKLTK
ncbi:MAG: tetratricopeptide repeat protein [Gammaproteobacteria bacterium]|nr:tetratricopeptide repeat protein [Gammaproteobacteria bacterium]MBU4046093.1 tetratricopeptide repeat protein [Gammaproteobacteria bacterium]MBU4150201.1 tetratricopeptide repeat protein [Gammaproteobacteria bacterium]